MRGIGTTPRSRATVISMTAIPGVAHHTSSSRLPLIALALASFGIGTTEFVIMGLLPTSRPISR